MQRLQQRNPAGRSADEAARLLAAEWALDDRDAPRALSLLAEMPPGVARRTQALRLKLQATRMARQPQEALRTAHLLANHQAFPKAAAQGLLPAMEGAATPAAVLAALAAAPFTAAAVAALPPSARESLARMAGSPGRTRIDRLWRPAT
jgi:hypothetical protein